MKPNLFDDSPDDVDELSKIEIDEEFAVRYEHNKNREDLQKLEELKKKGLVSDSSSESDSDSDYGVKSTKEDIELFDALLKVRNKDPVLKEKDAKLFDSPSDSESGDEDDDGENEKKREKKAGKKYLKDVNAEHLLEFGAEFGAREDEDEEEEEDVKKVKTYSDEQEELRKAFLDAVAEADGEAGDDGDFLKVKSKEGEEEEDGEEIKERLNKFFGEDEKLDENELFLKKFFENRMWIDKEGKTPGIDEDIELSDDEEEIERQEDYEREYNFRFEENAGDRVQSHSRFAMDSVRKIDNPRKEQRKRKKERMEQAELERREEVKRLKNLKKKEIMEKINKIKQVAGLDDGVDIPLTEADLEEDFDPEKYDRQMKSAFGEEYYDAEDADSDFVRDGDEGDLEKPDFEKEDKLLGLPEDWDVCKPGEGFLSEREKYLETLEEVGGESGGEGEEDVENDVGEPSEGKRKRKKKMSLREKVALDKDLEELYKLDYEDTIGDLKTRFKYKPVVPKRYGLSADELLAVDEKELNQVISIKKLAPYREKEWTVPHTKLMDLKRKSREQKTNEKRFGKDESRKHKKRKTGEHAMGAEKEREKEKQTTDDSVAMSRKEKRKHRKSELKISESRLMAYGKIPSKSKNKSKN